MPPTAGTPSPFCFITGAASPRDEQKLAPLIGHDQRVQPRSLLATIPFVEMTHKNIQQHLEPFDQLGRAPGAARKPLDQIADAGTCMIESIASFESSKTCSALFNKHL